MFAVGLALLIGGLIVAGGVGIVCMYDFNSAAEQAGFIVLCSLGAVIAIIVGAVVLINTAAAIQYIICREAAAAATKFKIS